MLEYADQLRLTDALADAVHGCGLPFNLVEHPKFVGMLKSFRPGYNPPSRKEMGNQLLDETYERVIKTNKSYLGDSPEAVLLIDGWKNSAANKKIVATLQQLENSCIFLDAVDMSTTPETSEALVDLVDKSVEIAKTKYKATVKTVISDNAANMIKMGRLCGMLYSRCNAHIANLIMKDISKIKNRKEIVDQIVQVLKEFKKPALETELLKVGGTRAYLPNETRWCANRTALQNYQKNLKFYKIIGNGHQVDKNVQEKVMGNWPHKSTNL